jgi:hypothetical protein
LSYRSAEALRHPKLKFMALRHPKLNAVEFPQSLIKETW